MCPDQQLLSVYMDDELPSPWKEKMEAHLAECPVCVERLNLYRQLSVKPADIDIETAKDRVWQNLRSRQSARRFQPFNGNIRRSALWQRRLSIPLPVAAAAAIIIMLAAALWFRGDQVNNNGFAMQQAEPADRTNLLFVAEEEIPTFMPIADINGVLQFLASDGTDVIILRLPENRSFSRTGEPEMIRAADYKRRSLVE